MYRKVNKFNKLLNNSHSKLKEILQDKLKINLMHASNFWEIYLNARESIYPNIDPAEETLSDRAAEKLLNGHFGRNTIASRKNDGTLRTINGQVVKKDITLIKTLFDIFDQFVELGAILPTTDINNKKVYAIVPQQISNIGKSRNDQKLESLKQLFTSKEGKAIIQALTA